LRACCPRVERTGGRDREGIEVLREVVCVLQRIVAGMLLLTVIDLEGRIVVEEREERERKGNEAVSLESNQSHQFRGMFMQS